MSLQIVTGSSGAGKSYTIYKELIDVSMAHPEKQYLVIVPEQFTMQAQKELVRMHPRKGLLNVDVLSFNRLAWRVFEEVGGNRLPILEETGKALIVQRMIAEQQRHLQVLGGALHRQGAAAQMKSLFSELMQYGIKPDDLGAWRAEQGDTMLARKIADVEILYRAFREHLEERYLAAEEIPEALSHVIGESALIQGSTIILDGFTGFTPLQYKVIQELLLLAESVTVPVTIDPSEDPLQKSDPFRLFAMSNTMVQKLVDLARQTQTEILPIRKIEAGKESRFKDSAPLQFLEEHIFRFHKVQYPGAPEKIRLFEASDPRAELRHITAEILRQVREDGRQFKDFALLTGDPDSYGEEAAAMFEAEGIPFFLDRKSSVLTNGLIEGIRAALMMVAKSYSYDSVFRYLKSGLSSLSREEVDELENYVLACGIRGRRRYEAEWEKETAVFTEEDLTRLNTLRERFLEETRAFHDGLHDRSGNIRTKTETLRRFLEQQQAEDKLQSLQERLLEEGDVVRAKEYAQTPGTVQALLEKVADVLGDEKAGVAAYAELLDAGFGELTIGTIPPGEDQVMIGDIERTRLNKIKVLFLAGVNEGIIPRPVKNSGILSEADRETLREADMELAHTPREEIYRQRFYLYLAMTNPSSELFLSYAKADKSGEALLPSDLIRSVTQLFPDLETERGEGEDLRRDLLETDGGKKRILLAGLQELAEKDLTDEAKEILISMREGSGEAALAERLLDAAGGLQREPGIGETIAKALYGKDLINSATRLESFAACAFRHFCNYGLRLREREVYDFTPADFGTIMHAALESYARTLQEEGRPWRNLTEEEQASYADRALAAAQEQVGFDALEGSGRGMFLQEQIRRLLYRTVRVLQTQIEHGEFEPTEFEFEFAGDLEASSLRIGEDSTMRVTGRVDRLDICDTEDARFIKIIDYKTGKTTFDLNKLYYGLQMQLLLYLNAAVEREQRNVPGKNVEPAGVFYYRIDDPLTETGSAEAAEAALLKTLRPDGRCRSEDDVLGLLDSDLKRGDPESYVIPVKRKKDGMPDASSKVADGSEFALMRSYAEAKATELGRRIMNGETGVEPYVYKDEHACKYCPYKGVCGFDPSLPGHAYRQLQEQKKEELYDSMKAYTHGLDD